MVARPPWRVAPRIIRLPDGTGLLVRQVEPGDARLIPANIGKMTREDIHHRFFEYMTSVPPHLVERLTHGDPVGDLALVALPLPGAGGPDDAYGVVRVVSTGADHGEAEYAVTVRHDWQGRGLGWALTEQILEEARRRGLSSIFALVLRDNVKMIRMLREFGFRIAPDPHDFSIVRAILSLADDGSLEDDRGAPV